MERPEVAISVLVVAFFVVLLFCLIQSARKSKKRMDELWAAAYEADRKFYAALFTYLTTPLQEKKEEE